MAPGSGFVVGDPQRKGCPNADHAGGGNLATPQLGRLLRNRQPQPGALGLRAALELNLAELGMSPWRFRVPGVMK